MAAREGGLVVQDSELRLLETAIAVSIVVHVVAFSLLHAVTPKVESAATSPSPISARLVELTPPAPLASATPIAPPAPAADRRAPAPLATAAVEVAVPSEAANPERVPVPHAANRPTPEPTLEPAPQTMVRKQTTIKRNSRSRPKTKTKVAKTTDTAEANQAKLTLRTPTVAKPPASASARPAVRAAPPPSSASPLASVAPSPSATAVDANLLLDYRRRLIGAARRYKRYPRAAIDNEWEGAAEVAMVVGANGRIRAMTISKTSGHAVLDRQALDMFRKAKPLVPIPGALRGREFRVSVKAIYSLREPGA
jgi:protein TonB